MSRNKKTSAVRVILSLSGLCLPLAAAAYIVGCGMIETKPKKPEGTVIARVGDSYLTLEELEASIPPEYSGTITREQNIQYVRQWLNTELLYQEALRLDLDQTPEITARLEKMKKDLLSSEVINRAAFDIGSLVNDQTVREYYERHRDKFRREHSVVRYETIVVDDRDLAIRLRHTATHETFGELARTHSKGESTGNEGNAPYVPVDDIPVALRHPISIAAVPSITGPYREELGTVTRFHVLRVVSKHDRGSIASLEEVRDEITARLSNNAQKSETERLMADIRSREEIVEFHIDLIPGIDTTTPPEEEETE